MSAINGRSILVGLIGAGIQQSKTPDLHMEEGRRQGLAYVYKLIDLDSLRLKAEALPEILHAVRLSAFDGLNITFPASKQSFPISTSLERSERHRRGKYCGHPGEKLIGHNTDCTGFGKPSSATWASNHADGSYKRGLAVPEPPSPMPCWSRVSRLW